MSNSLFTIEAIESLRDFNRVDPPKLPRQASTSGLHRMPALGVSPFAQALGALLARNPSMKGP